MEPQIILTKNEQVIFSSKEFLSLKTEFQNGIIKAYRKHKEIMTISPFPENIAFLSLLLQEIDDRRAFTINENLYEDLMFFSLSLSICEEELIPQRVKEYNNTIIFLLPMLQKIKLKEWYLIFSRYPEGISIYKSLSTFMETKTERYAYGKQITIMNTHSLTLALLYNNARRQITRLVQAAISTELKSQDLEQKALHYFSLASISPASSANSLFKTAHTQLLKHELFPFLTAINPVIQEYVDHKEFASFIGDARRKLNQAPYFNSTIERLKKDLSLGEIKLRVLNLLFALPQLPKLDDYRTGILISLMMKMNNSYLLDGHKDAKIIIANIKFIISQEDQNVQNIMVNTDFSLNDFSSIEHFNKKFLESPDNMHSFFNFNMPSQRQKFTTEPAPESQSMSLS